MRIACQRRLKSKASKTGEKGVAIGMAIAKTKARLSRLLAKHRSVPSDSSFFRRMHSKEHHKSILCGIKQQEASQHVESSSIVTTKGPKKKTTRGKGKAAKKKTRRAHAHAQKTPLSLSFFISDSLLLRQKWLPPASSFPRSRSP